MKCEVSGAPPCRRCRHNQTPCIFKPRANVCAKLKLLSLPSLLTSDKASALHELVEEAHNELLASRSSTYDQQSVLDRLDRIEAALGIGQDAPQSVSVTDSLDLDDETDSVPLQGVWKAVAHLRFITHPVTDENIWSRPIVKRLWSS
jgi:hypothetical protein